MPFLPEPTYQHGTPAKIGILLINHGDQPFVVRRGDRIAQMIVQRVCRVQWDVHPELNPTGRGDGGFGHTKK